MRDREKVLDREVFTPTSTNPRAFVERTELNYDFFYALDTPGKQIVIYGHSGSGKTTLIRNKLSQTFEREITTQCMSGMTYEQLILNAFDQLNIFYKEQRTQSKKAEVSSSIQAEYLSLKSAISGTLSSENAATEKRALPLQLTAQNLVKFLGEAKCCWVLEDFHKIGLTKTPQDSDDKRKFAQTMKIFCDMSDKYPQTKIIAVGAVDSPREVIDLEPEMRNRVSEIEVPLMTDDEMQEIIDKGEKLLNFTIPIDIKRKIVDFSNGLASVCHDLCLRICYAAGIRETLQKPITITDVDFDEALDRYIRDASDTLKSTFDNAFRNGKNSKFEHGKIIIRALTNCDFDGTSIGQLQSKIKEFKSDYTGNLKYHLDQLLTNERGSLIRFDSATAKYSFSTPIYRAYAMVLFSDPTFSRATEMEKINTEYFRKSLKKAILEIKVTNFRLPPKT